MTRAFAAVAKGLFFGITLGWQQVLTWYISLRSIGTETLEVGGSTAIGRGVSSIYLLLLSAFCLLCDADATSVTRSVFLLSRLPWDLLFFLRTLRTTGLPPEGVPGGGSSPSLADKNSGLSACCSARTSSAVTNAALFTFGAGWRVALPLSVQSSIVGCV